MSWTTNSPNSRIFAKGIEQFMNRTATALDMDADTFKAALFDNTVTPDATVTAANSAYAAGTWASGGVSDASGWPAAGRAVTLATASSTTATYTYDVVDTASANSTTTLTNAYGTLVYDDTATSVADEGVCYNYFGGANSVTSGTFTIVWHSSGVFTIAV